MAQKPLRDNTSIHSRIKKMMQADDDVGRVAKATPILISTALELFLEGLLNGSSSIAKSRGAKFLTASHLKAHITSDPLFDFLTDSVAAIPDLTDETAADETAPGRKRSSQARTTTTTATSSKKTKTEGGGGAKKMKKKSKKGEYRWDDDDDDTEEEEEEEGDINDGEFQESDEEEEKKVVVVEDNEEEEEGEGEPLPVDVPAAFMAVGGGLVRDEEEEDYDE